MSNELNQHQLPLLTALQACATRPHAAFYTPGHKRGQGIAQPLADLLGKDVFGVDLTELADLDNLSAPSGVIQQAQRLAAAAFGASQTWFLVNGSTCGLEAAILATCGTGDKIILPRNVHSSAIAGLILSGAIPIFVNPEYDPDLDIAHSITPDGLQAALQQHPDAKAVLTVYPTYYGVCGNLNAIAQITHEYHLPLLVDEAHGAHFAFHPQLPPSALAAGADLTVQSIHKVLGAMTQASMLHLQGDRIDIDRVSKALQLLQSTSPSYVLLASLDGARQQMALHGEQLMSRTLQLATDARTRISQIPGLSVLQLPTADLSPGFIDLDQTRLTVNVAGWGLTGFAVEEILDAQGVTAELATLQNLTFIISLGNTSDDIEQLVQSFQRLAPKKPFLCPLAQKEWQIHNDFGYALGMSPREAFFAVTEILPIKQTSDRICAEIVCPYPPGIPVLMPGEVITPSIVEYLQQIQQQGGLITGCHDPSMQTLKVVKSVVGHD